MFSTSSDMRYKLVSCYRTSIGKYLSNYRNNTKAYPNLTRPALFVGYKRDISVSRHVSNRYFS